VVTVLGHRALMAHLRLCGQTDGLLVERRDCGVAVEEHAHPASAGIPNLLVTQAQDDFAPSLRECCDRGPAAR
jgi:hypothetical protein